MTARDAWIRATVLRCDGAAGTCTREEQAGLAHDWGTYHDDGRRLDLCPEHRARLSADLGMAQELPARGFEGKAYQFEVVA